MAFRSSRVSAARFHGAAAVSQGAPVATRDAGAGSFPTLVLEGNGAAKVR